MFMQRLARLFFYQRHHDVVGGQAHRTGVHFDEDVQSHFFWRLGRQRQVRQIECLHLVAQCDDLVEQLVFFIVIVSNRGRDPMTNLREDVIRSQ